MRPLKRIIKLLNADFQFRIGKVKGELTPDFLYPSKIKERVSRSRLALEIPKSD